MSLPVAFVWEGRRGQNEGGQIINCPKALNRGRDHKNGSAVDTKCMYATEAKVQFLAKKLKERRLLMNASIMQ